jgi:hypothetical protein
MTKYLSILESIVLLFVGAVVSFLVAWYWIVRGAKVKAAEKLAEATLKLESRVVELEGKLTLLNQTVMPLSTAFQNKLVEMLTHAHTPEIDGWLAKLGPPNTLTEEEAILLTAALKDKITDKTVAIPDSERTAAEILPLVIRLAKEETASLAAGPSQLKMVTVVSERK